MTFTIRDGKSFDEGEQKSLTFKFNTSFLSAFLYEGNSSVSHERVRLWMGTQFRKWGISPKQSEYSDTCAEKKCYGLSA